MIKPLKFLTPEQLAAGLKAINNHAEDGGKSMKADPRRWVEIIGAAVLGVPTTKKKKI